MAATSVSTVNTGARVWTPYRELLSVVEAALFKKQPDAIQDLDIALRKHKPDFISLLKNPVRSTHLRELLKKADVTGLQIHGEQRSQTFSQQFINEAITISDLFELHELASVELLIAGEDQQANFPGLTRGLVAVLLYYDGQRSLVNALRALIKSRQGRTWTLGLDDDLVSMTTKFTDELLNNGIINRILDLLSSMDLNKELERLKKERALGTYKHRKQVTDLWSEIKLSLAECLFCLACQVPLSKDDTLRLIQHLMVDNSVRPDGTRDHVTICLLMTLLYSFDVTVLELDTTEENTRQLSLPILNDPTYIEAIHKEMTCNVPWTTPGLKATAQFAWALTLRQLSQYQNTAGSLEVYEDDEVIIDTAITHDFFSFLDKEVIASSIFHEEEFYVRRVHGLFTDFIFLMPLKWKELRNRGDETARIIRAHISEGLAPPTTLRSDFEHLLNSMSNLYKYDPLGLELSLDYWTTLDNYVTPESYITPALSRSSPKQASLYKFLRLAGDMLPAALFVPYVNMLSGMSTGCQSAQHCFNLLHNNAVGSASPGSMVSWDHIFHSLNQYYTNLRREMPSSTPDSFAPTYRSAHPRAITPEEVDGLVAVLGLIQQLADQNENVRIALCENQDWMMVVLLFGLLSCAIPLRLKADILATLASLAKTAEIASNMWQSLEMSQILCTVKTGSDQGICKSSGIQVELEEIETRSEHYPLTRAFLTLLHSLTDVPVPPALGAGYRLPGFTPYLNFIRDDVFLKFQSRAYKNSEEKWQVASCCLAVLSKILSQYEPSPADFNDQYIQTPTGSDVAAKSPGYTVMVHMLNESGLLKTILAILDEGVRLLETSAASSERSSMERASLLCLTMIRTTLEFEPVFLDLLRESGSSLIVSSMDRLLMAVNHQSGIADHLLNIVKYVTFTNSLPHNALAAVKIVHGVSRTASIQSQLVALFTTTETKHVTILHGFVESLEIDEPEMPESPDDSSTEDLNSESRVRNSLRQEILSLLLTSMKLPAPNLAHLLLGFELRKPVRKTTLQAPGILGSPKTCLHALLNLLDAGTQRGPACLGDAPILSRLAYQLVYTLCMNRDTSVPFMRYLRTTWDFLYKQLQCLPFCSSADHSTSLPHQAWLLKAIAIELRVTSLNRQRSHTHRLVHSLINDVLSDHSAGYADQIDQDVTYITKDLSSVKRAVTSGQQTKRKILTILDSLDFTQRYQAPLQLDFFEPHLIEEQIELCACKTDDAVTYYDVKTLNRVLVSEVDNLHGTTLAAQRPLVLQEIQYILRAVASRNTVSVQLHEKREAFRAWRELVEVLLCACPADVMPQQMRMDVILEVLQALLKKVSDDEAMPELTSPTSRVILTLTTNLMQCFHGDRLIDQSLVDQYPSGVSGSRIEVDVQLSPSVGGTTGSRTLYGTSLQIVLKGIIEYIFKVGGAQQGVRANLYGALLFYLQIAQKPKPQPTLSGNAGVSRVLTSRDTSEYDKLSQENMATLSSYGNNLLDIICRDCCDANDVTRMLALCVLGELLSLDKLQQWLSFLSSKGYLQHLVDSLLDDDAQLQSVMGSESGSLKILYIYQSKMCVLSRIASTQYGSQLLLRSAILQRLAQCVSLDMRPDHPKDEIRDKYTDPYLSDDTVSHHHQLLEPALSLCLSLLTSAGMDNFDARGQVMQFVVSHIDVIHSILRTPYTHLDTPSLHELALTTAILSRSAYQDDANEFLSSEAAMLEYRGHVTRIQRLMIGLLTKLTGPLCSISTLSGVAPDDQEDTQSHLAALIQEIVANTVTFCRNLLVSSGMNAKHTHILFGPDMTEAFARDPGRLEEYHTSTMKTGASARSNLGFVVCLLKRASQQFSAAYDSHQTIHKKLQTLNELNNEDLRQLSGVDITEKTSTQHRQKLASHALQSRLAARVTEMQRLSYTTENLLFILWRHLVYYLLHCVPTKQKMTAYPDHSRIQKDIRRLNDFSMSYQQTPRAMYTDDYGALDERMTGASSDEIALLKTQVSAAINETLLKNIQEIYQIYGRSHSNTSFTDAIVRRIKRLIKLHTNADIASPYQGQTSLADRPKSSYVA